MTFETELTRVIGLFQLPFMQRALMGGVLTGLMGGLLGSFTILRQLSFFSDALGHSALLGISIGLLLGVDPSWVLLAYCMVRPRSLLILDEAPAGLDVRGESEFYQLLYQLKQEQGWAILQISHDLDMVRRSCDRVLCINRRLLCQGPPDHALAPEQLSLAYGPDLVRYHHTCQPHSHDH
jgi:ABC-type Mn2+/Zn2+ transport system ATPase subunit